MHRERVVHFRADPLLFEKVAQRVALWRSHGELVIDVKISGRRQWKRNAIRMLRLRKQLLISFGVPTSASIPLVKILQLDLEHGSLERIQPAIDPYRLVEIANLASMDTEHGQRVGKGFVVGRDEPPISKTTQVLAGEKTEAPCVSKYTSALPLLCRPYSLASILDDANIFPLCYFIDRSHIRTLPEEVNGNDCFRTRGNRLLDQLGVDIERIRLNVHEHRLRAQS